jgi:signal transduction histidine kinase
VADFDLQWLKAATRGMLQMVQSAAQSPCPFPIHRIDPMRWVAKHPRTSIGLLGAFLLIAGGAAIGQLNVRNLRRIAVIQSQLEDLEQIRGLQHRLEISLLDDVREAIPVGSFLAEEVRLQVESALAMRSFLAPETEEGLRRIEALLSRPGLVTRNTLASALELAGELTAAEAQAQRALLVQIQADGRREFGLGILVVLAMAALAGLLAWFLPKRLLDPLGGLRDRISALGEGRFEPVPTEGIEPGLLPLFNNYNAMVDRMAVLEAERKARAETLEEEVRAAARTLAEQHRTLATAERLAAVGETAAGVAHELRNPMAGILAALENLKREVTDQPLADRLELLGNETRRVVGLLNEYLAAARHDPEAFRKTDVGGLVQEMASLLRYQLPPNVSLEVQVPGELACFLPNNRIRQVVLNLVWNAVEALNSKPGTVTISARQEQGFVVLEVADDGPGFPAELLETPVQAFRTSRTHGTGLGLAMVRRTAADLGGRMTLENRPNGGALVRLSVPCQEKEEG